MSDNSYFRRLADYYDCDPPYDTVWQSFLDELTDKVDVSWVKSCVAMGTGGGTNELGFARRFLPNLQSFVAIEPDHESVKALRTSLQALFIMLLLIVIITGENIFLVHSFRKFYRLD